MPGRSYEPPPPRRGRQRWGEPPQSTPDGGIGGGKERYTWRGQRRRGPLGCLLWLVTLAIVLIALSLLFGGFRHGARVGSGVLGGAGPAATRMAGSGHRALPGSQQVP